MEEIVFKALQGDTKFATIENFINSIIVDNSNEDLTYEEVKESIIKLVLYQFIKVDNTSTADCISREENFYQAEELGGVNLWLEQKRALSTVA
ncbi:hypothetical protein [Tenacibaculum sp. 190524A05c]